MDRLDINVLVITFQQQPTAEAYVRETDLSWPLLVDPSRTLYQAYEMNRGRAIDIWGPASIWVYLKLMLRGRRLHRPAGDISQLGGDVLIDPAGIVRLHHIGSGPADRPTIESILETMRQHTESGSRTDS